MNFRTAGTPDKGIVKKPLLETMLSLPTYNGLDRRLGSDVNDVLRYK